MSARRNLTMIHTLLTLVIVSTVGCAGNPVTIVQDGQPAATIVLSETASTQVKQAAEALQDYVQRMSGAQIPIVTDAQPAQGPRILIGQSRATADISENLSEDRLGFDGCVARTLGNDLVFLGPGDHGAANGVYWFLNWKLGVHWFGLRSDGLHIPQGRTVTVEPFNYAHKPSFAWRSSWISSSHMAFTADERANHVRSANLNRRGGIELSGAHSLLYLVPPEKFFDEHPEYFPLINGKRQAKGQLCLSNSDVRRIVVEELKKYDPQITRFATVSPNDHAGWCQCEPCKQMAENPAARMMIFCSQVVGDVESTHPKLGACFLAYDVSETMEPPLGLTAHERVTPMIAPLGLIPVHPIDSPDCPNAKEMRRIYEGWQQVTPGGTVTYPYMFGGDYPDALSLPIPAVVARDTRYYHRAGVMGMQREHVGHYYIRGFGWELSYWLEWQLFWDIDQDEDELRRVFYEGYYGAAAEPMARIYQRIESAVLKSPVSDHVKKSRGWQVHQCVGELPGTLLATLAANRDDLLEALKLADTPAARAHVKADGLALTAMDEATTAYIAHQNWISNPSEANLQSALTRINEAIAKIDRILANVPYAEHRGGRKRLDDRLRKLRDELNADIPYK